MTEETGSSPAGAPRGGPAEPGPARPGLPDRMARYGVWVAVLAHIVLHDRRFQASVITRAIGAYALGNVAKNNQARPLRRVSAWYNVQGQIHDMEVLHQGRRALKQANARSGDDPGRLSHGWRRRCSSCCTSRWPSWPGSLAACFPG